ncbi:MAG TPA: DnaJ domain-containing protein, partial [Myxococcota bacterium]|nr:DnaJ domain-containing protein [Myxococcota bacterium]
YELLGVARDAAPAAIRRAYVAAAKRFHPDAVARAGLPELRAAADAVFARIAEANNVLSDPQRRRDYEAVLDGGVEDIDTARLIQAESLFRKAEILLRGGNWAGALEFLRPCIGLWPEDATYQSSTGWALYKKSPSDPKTAREHLEKAIALDANDAISHFRLGMVLRALGDTANAEVALGRAKRLDPKVKA